jgi:hypothetical protein
MGINLCRYCAGNAVSQALLDQPMFREMLDRRVGPAGGWRVVRAVRQVESSRPIDLESAWFQPLILKRDILVSKFASLQIFNLFKFNLYRYSVASGAHAKVYGGGGGGTGEGAEGGGGRAAEGDSCPHSPATVGLYKLNPVDP